MFDGVNVLITGGTGSFGNAFVKFLLENYNPNSIRVYSRGEHKQLDMQRRFNNDDRLRFFIGDIRDKDRLYRAMNDVDYVVHAAALKHVHVCEYNPIEAVKTNVEGTANVVDAAIDNGIKKSILISTDKAVQPLNLYGATKAVAEKLFIQANSYSGKRSTRFSVSRYGNVLGSNGSVVPLFIKQSREGYFTITDERMTRFWITLSEGVKFVANALSIMKGGEVFVPKLPSIRIADLAKAINPDAEIKYIGIRPGEKLHEVLISPDEARRTIDTGEFYVILPEFNFWGAKFDYEGTPLKDGFMYSSNSSNYFMGVNEIRALLKKEGFI